MSTAQVHHNTYSCDNPAHTHQWPTSGHIAIERCEHYCLFCTGQKAKKRWSSAWFLRRHVRDYHVKHEFPLLVVAEGWQARPMGNTRPVNKKQRAPGSNKKRGGTKRQLAARIRNNQTALYNSLSNSTSSASTFSNSSGTGTTSTYPTSIASQPYWSGHVDSYDNTANNSAYPFQFDQNESDILTHIGAFLQPSLPAYDPAPMAVMMANTQSPLASNGPVWANVNGAIQLVDSTPAAQSAPVFDKTYSNSIAPQPLNTTVDPAMLSNVAELQQFPEFDINNIVKPQLPSDFFSEYTNHLADTMSFELDDNAAISSAPSSNVFDNTVATSGTMAPDVSDIASSIEEPETEPFPAFSQEIADSIDFENYFTGGPTMFDDAGMFNDVTMFDTEPTPLFRNQLALDNTFLPSFENSWYNN